MLKDIAAKDEWRKNESPRGRLNDEAAWDEAPAERHSVLLQRRPATRLAEDDGRPGAARRDAARAYDVYRSDGPNSESGFRSLIDPRVVSFARAALEVGAKLRTTAARAISEKTDPRVASFVRSTAIVAANVPATVARNVVEAFVPPPAQERDHESAIRRLWVKGWVFIAAFFGVFAIWAAAASMSSAVIGAGQFVVDSSVKKVQHPNGGVVGDLRVREGVFVREGDLLLRLDETVIRSNLQVVVKQLGELFGRRGRLLAERDGGGSYRAPQELAALLSEPEVARIVAEERNLFDARRSARDGQRAQLIKRVAQMRNEIVGFRSQLDANARESTIIAEELKGVRDLFNKNLVPIMRLTTLERQAVNLEGQRGQLTASIAQTDGRIGETELQIMQIEDDLRAASQKEMREDDAKIAELSERRIAAEDQLKRVELRSPATGYVHQLAVHTVGGVITAAEPVMLIVPAQEELFIEAKVTPQDRDQLQVGQAARVRVSSSNRRNTPELTGSVTRISADVSKEANAPASFYSVRVAVPKAEIARLRDVSIVAGMQAEVFIEAGARTPLQYLLKPLSDQIARAFRER